MAGDWQWEPSYCRMGIRFFWLNHSKDERFCKIFSGSLIKIHKLVCNETKKCRPTTKKYPITKAENVLVCPLNINCKHRNLIKQLKYDHFHIRHGWIGNYDRAPTVPNINVQNGVTVPEILWFDAEDQLKHQKKRTNLPASPHQKKISIYSRSTLKPAYYEPRLCLRWRPLVVIVVMAAKEADR